MMTKIALFILQLYLMRIGINAGDVDVSVKTDGDTTTGTASTSFEVGDADVKVSGSVDTNGGWSGGVSVGWDWKRRRRSIEYKFCKSCIGVGMINSPKQRMQLQGNKAIGFAMTVKFDKLFYNSTFTEIDFKVDEILREVPIKFDSKHAKTLKIYASHSVCAMACLNGITPGEYLVIGKQTNDGKLVISGKLLLIRLNKKTLF